MGALEVPCFMSNIPQNNNDRRYAMLAFRILADFGATIAVPVVVFVLVGQWLDGKYDKSPWFTVIAFLLAALVSGKMIYDKAKRYGKEYEGLNNKDEKK
jgi:F0F1-type ATP synthase assembly protein I